MMHADLRDVRVVPVIQGEYKISSRPDEVLTTLLGSCIAVCLHDPEARLGGMNHFLLPGDPGSQSTCLRYGTNAMELMINSLVKQGAAQGRLQAKVFGGAKLLTRQGEIGEANARFAFWFLENEQIPVISQDTGGKRGRKLRFWPTSGRVQLMLIDDTSEITAAESRSPGRQPPTAVDGGDVTLF